MEDSTPILGQYSNRSRLKTVPDRPSLYGYFSYLMRTPIYSNRYKSSLLDWPGPCIYSPRLTRVWFVATIYAPIKASLRCIPKFGIRLLYFTAYYILYIPHTMHALSTPDNSLFFCSHHFHLLILHQNIWIDWNFNPFVPVYIAILKSRPSWQCSPAPRTILHSCAFVITATKSHPLSPPPIHPWQHTPRTSAGRSSFPKVADMCVGRGCCFSDLSSSSFLLVLSWYQGAWEVVGGSEGEGMGRYSRVGIVFRDGWGDMHMRTEWYDTLWYVRFCWPVDPLTRWLSKLRVGNSNGE